MTTYTSWRVGNWPPHYPAIVDPPAGLLSDLREAEAACSYARAQLAEWYAETIARRHVAWEEWKKLHT